MNHRYLWLTRLVWLLPIVLLSSCGLWSKHSPKKSSPGKIAADSRFIGTISMVNKEAHFVLVDFGGFSAPASGVELHILRDGQDVATLRAGSEVRRPFAVADILTGAPEIGDDVWLKTAVP